jgi:hypothetical protein
MFVWCFVERTTSTASFFSFPMYQEGASRRIDVGSDQRLAPRNLVSRWSLGNPFLQCHSLGLKEAHAEMSEANRAEARDMKNGVSFGCVFDCAGTIVRREEAWRERGSSHEPKTNSASRRMA